MLAAPRAPLLLLALAAPLLAEETTLEVGPGKAFERIEDAYAKAEPGDTILVHPRPDNAPYGKVALQVRKPRLSFKAAVIPRIPLSGDGFDYHGEGPVPRAMFQFDPGADGCILEGFVLSGARNQSCNGAGVRINQANRISIRDCEITGNDMGIMSNGNATLEAAADQRIEFCEIHGNGTDRDYGQNHNLYLGGASVTVRGCDIHSSVAGHNVKSRAHVTRLEHNFIHHAAEREIDLVDNKETALPGSDAILLGNIIRKHPQCPGNQGVIHFGQDGGNDHDGTLVLVHNTIVTPFVTHVVDLSAPKAKARLVNNLLWNGGGGPMQVARARNGAQEAGIEGSHNWAPRGVQATFGAKFATGGSPRLADDFRLTARVDGIVDAGLPWAEIGLGGAGPRQYLHPAADEQRPEAGAPDIGAYEYAPGEAR